MTHSFTSIGRPQFLGLAAILLVYLLGLSSVSYAQIHYVTLTGTGDGSGSSSGNAASATALQGIINSLSATGGTVLVGAGLYTPTEGGGFNPFNTSFTIPNGVKVYGGYPADFNANNRTINPSSSTLSGFISGSDDRILPPNKNGQVQVYHVVYFDGISSDARRSPGKLDKSAADNEVVDTRRLDGFVITGGKADGDGEAASGGGGVFIFGYYSFCQPTIANCTLINNSAIRGGAMYSYGRYSGNANPYVLNCSFINNTATEGGGAIYNDGAYGSSADDHGNASGEYTNCTFINNSAENGGGAIYNNASESGMASPTITSCSFSGNRASGGNGGAIYNLATAPSGGGGGRIADNKAAKGAAESQSGTSAPLIINSSFDSNSATGAGLNGGAIYNESFDGGVVSATIVNCSFIKNRADYGGAIYNYESDGDCSPVFVNCSFSGNTVSQRGSALYNDEDVFCTLLNCIIGGVSWDNGEEASNLIHNSDDEPTLVSASYCLFQTGTGDFVDGPGGDNRFTSTSPFISDTNLQLATPSTNTAAAAAINSGNDAAYVGSYPTTDLAGNARRIGQIDRGAFEYQASPVSQTGCADIIIIPVTNFAASGSLSCANPKVKLTASGTGSAFVVTGPNGYVFSNVYRYCDNHSVLAIDVNLPGQYILKVYHGQSLYSTHSVTVAGTTCP